MVQILIEATQRKSRFFSTSSSGSLANNMIPEDSYCNKSPELTKWLSHPYVLDGFCSQGVHGLDLKQPFYGCPGNNPPLGTLPPLCISNPVSQHSYNFLLLLSLHYPTSLTSLVLLFISIRQERNSSFKQIEFHNLLHHNSFPTSHTHFF